jgi:hypothetical protein
MNRSGFNNGASDRHEKSARKPDRSMIWANGENVVCRRLHELVQIELPELRLIFRMASPRTPGSQQPITLVAIGATSP